MEHRREPMGGEVDSDQVIGLDWTNDCMIGSGQANCIEAANTSSITFGSINSDQFVDDLALKVRSLLLNLEENEPSFIENPQNSSVQSIARSMQDLDFRTLQHPNNFEHKSNEPSIVTHDGRDVLFSNQAILTPVSKGSCSEKFGSSQSSNKSYDRQRKSVDLKIEESSSQSSINKSFQLPKILVNEKDINRRGLDALQGSSNRSSKIDACASYKVFTNTLQNVSSRAGHSKTPECEESHNGRYQLSLKLYLFSGGAEQTRSCNADNNSVNQSRISLHSDSDARHESLEKEAERSWSEITVKAESFNQPREYQTRTRENSERNSRLSFSKASCSTEASTTRNDIFTQIPGVDATTDKLNLSARPKSSFANKSKLSAIDNSNMSQNFVDYSNSKARNSDANVSRLSAVGNNNASLNLVDSSVRPRNSLRNTSQLGNINNKNVSRNIVGSNARLTNSSKLSGTDNNNMLQNVLDYNTRPENITRLGSIDNSILNVDNDTRLANSSNVSDVANKNTSQDAVDYNRRLTSTSRLSGNDNRNMPMNMVTSSSRFTSTSRQSGVDNSNRSQNVVDYNTRLTNAFRPSGVDNSNKSQNAVDYNSRVTNTSRLSGVDNSCAVDCSNTTSLTSCSRSMSRASMDDWRLSLFEPSRSDFDPIGRDTPPLSASSVASSRRLEWDNGADIGYRTVPCMDWPNSTTTLISNSRTIPEMARSDPEGISLMNETINVSLGPSQTVFPYFQLNSGTSSVSIPPNPGMSSPDSSIPNLDDEFLQASNVTNPDDEFLQALNATNLDHDFCQALNITNPDEFLQASNTTNPDEDFLKDSNLTNMNENFFQAFKIANFHDFCHSSSVANLNYDFCEASSVTEDLLERSSSPGSLSRSDSKRSVIYNSVRDMRHQADSKIEMTHFLQPFKNTSCPNLTNLKNPLEMHDWSLSKSEEQVGTSKEVKSSTIKAFLSSGFHNINHNTSNLQSSYLNEAIDSSTVEKQSSYSGIVDCNRKNVLFSIQDTLEDCGRNNPQTCRTCQMPLNIENHQVNSDIHYSNLQNTCRDSEVSFEIEKVVDSVYGIAQQHVCMDRTTNDLQYVTEIPDISSDNPHSRPVLVVSNNLSELDGRNFSKIVSNFFQNSSASDQTAGSSEVKPHIRWYPFSPTATVQDIKDVSTQTAVSFVAQQSKDAASFVGQPSKDTVSLMTQVTKSSNVAQTSKNGSSLSTQTSKNVVLFGPQASNDTSVRAVFEQHTSSLEDIVLEWIPGHLSLSQMQSFTRDDGDLQRVSPLHLHPSRQNDSEAYPDVLKSESAQTSWNQQESLKNNVLPLYDGGKSQTCQSCQGDLNADSLSLNKDGQISTSGTFRRLDTELANYSRSGSSDVAYCSSNETLSEASVLLQNPNALREERMLGVGECQTIPKTLLNESMSSTTELKVNSPEKNSSKVSAPQFSVLNIRKNIPHHENASTGTSSYVQNLVTPNQYHGDASQQQNSKNIAISNHNNVEATTPTWNKLQESASEIKTTENNAMPTTRHVKTFGNHDNDGLTIPSNTQNRFVSTSSNLLEFFSRNKPLSDSKYLEHNEGIPKSYSDPLLSGHDQDLIGHDQDCSGYGQDWTSCAQCLTSQDQDWNEHCHEQDLSSHDQDWTGHDQVSTVHSQDMTGQGQDLTDQELNSEEDGDLVTFQSHDYGTFDDSELASGDGMYKEKHRPDSFHQEKHITSPPKKIEFGFGDNASNQNVYLALREDHIFEQNLLLEQKKLLSSKFDRVLDFPLSHSTSEIADLTKTTMLSREGNQSLPEQSGLYFERSPLLDPLSNFGNTYIGKVSNGHAEIYASKTSVLQKGLSERDNYTNPVNPSRKEVQVQTEASIGRLSTNLSQFQDDFNKPSNTGAKLGSKSATTRARNYINAKVRAENENHNTPQSQESSSVFSNYTKSMNPTRRVPYVQTGTDIGISSKADNLQFQDNFNEHNKMGDRDGRKSCRYLYTMSHDSSKDKINLHTLNDSYRSPSQSKVVYNTGSQARQPLIDTPTCIRDIYADNSSVNSVINAHTPVGINCDKSTSTSQLFGIQNEKRQGDMYANRRNSSASESYKLQSQVVIKNDKSTMTKAAQGSFSNQNVTRPVMMDIYTNKIGPSRKISIETQAGIYNVRPSRDSQNCSDKQDITNIFTNKIGPSGKINVGIQAGTNNVTLPRDSRDISGKQEISDICTNKIGSSRKISVGTQARTNNVRPPRDSQDWSDIQEIADICTNKIGPSREINVKTQAGSNDNRPLSVSHDSFDEQRPKIESAKRDPLATNSNFCSVGIQASGSLLEADRCSFCHLRNSHFSRCPMKDRFKNILNQTLEKGLLERRKLYKQSGTSFFIFSKVCPCCINKSLQDKFNIHRAEIVERIEARQKEVETKTGRGLFSNLAPPLYQQKNKPRLKQVPVKSTTSQPLSNKENIRKTKKNHLMPLNSSKPKGHQKTLSKYNRVMSKIYSQRLKSEILKGKVSFSRHEVLMNS